MRVHRDDPTLFSILLPLLRRGGIAVMPCDTIYGIVGRSPDTEEKIRFLKGRRHEKPFIQLISSLEMLTDLTPARIPEELAAYWPGPLTLILPAKGGGTVAVRLPEAPLLRSVIRELASPLYSTSVNRSGEKPLWRIERIVERFEKDVDLIVEAGDLPGRLPSTVLDATSRPYRLIRQGAIRIPSHILPG